MMAEVPRAAFGVEVGTDGRGAPALRPRDAATIVLLDRAQSSIRVLVGKRSSSHVFMPDTYVFPGGRRDRNDHALPCSSDLNALVLERLLREVRASSPGRARALALAGVRELAEETGLAIGGYRPAADGAAPRLAAALHCLRYVARAITPPGNVRRFDTRFFCTFADEAGINPAAIRDSMELQDLRWIDINAISGLAMPLITRTILEDMRNLINNDPTLPFGGSVPVYFSRRGQSVRSSI